MHLVYPDVASPMPVRPDTALLHGFPFSLQRVMNYSKQGTQSRHVRNVRDLKETEGYCVICLTGKIQDKQTSRIEYTYIYYDTHTCICSCEIHQFLIY